MVDHTIRYALGKVHTNGVENFWSLLKRMIKGTYVAVAPFHLFRYVDEESWRFNQRTLTDGDRFAAVTAQNRNSPGNACPAPATMAPARLSTAARRF